MFLFLVFLDLGWRAVGPLFGMCPLVSQKLVLCVPFLLGWQGRWGSRSENLLDEANTSPGRKKPEQSAQVASTQGLFSSPMTHAEGMIMWKRGKGPHLHTFSLIKKTTSFLLPFDRKSLHYITIFSRINYVWCNVIVYIDNGLRINLSAMYFRAVYDWLFAQCLEHQHYITSIVWELIIENGM